VSKTILSKRQIKFLKLFSLDKNLSTNFYLTGGTALAEFYIPYRLSEDLDFFSENEFDLLPITIFLKSIKKELDYIKFDINTSFNRNIIHLIFKDEILKLEFTYFPFSQIEKPKRKNGIKIDSVIDIATNKVFTIYQKPRTRDFMDLYMINKNYQFKLNDLIKKAKIKFDWHIDPVKLGSQLMLARKLKDYPNLITPMKDIGWQKYFEEYAKSLKKEIFK